MRCAHESTRTSGSCPLRRTVLLYLVVLLFSIYVFLLNFLVLVACAIDGGELVGHDGLELRKLGEEGASARVKVRTHVRIQSQSGR